MNFVPKIKNEDTIDELYKEEVFTDLKNESSEDIKHLIASYKDAKVCPALIKAMKTVEAVERGEEIDALDYMLVHIIITRTLIVAYEKNLSKSSKLPSLTIMELN